MNCNKCSKIFCKNRDVNGCEDGISYLDAGIINPPKRIEYGPESYGITFKEACDVVAKVGKAMYEASKYIT